MFQHHIHVVVTFEWKYSFGASGLQHRHNVADLNTVLKIRTNRSRRNSKTSERRPYSKNLGSLEREDGEERREEIGSLRGGVENREK